MQQCGYDTTANHVKGPTILAHSNPPISARVISAILVLFLFHVLPHGQRRFSSQGPARAAAETSARHTLEFAQYERHVAGRRAHGHADDLSRRRPRPHAPRGAPSPQLCSANGVPLATLTPTTGGYLVFEGADTHAAPPIFRIHVQRTPTYAHTPVVFAEFQDVATGETCRLLTEGHADDRVVLVCLERGTTLSPIATENNADKPEAAAVAPLRRPKTHGVVFEGRERTYMEAEAGVDLTLLTMLWCVRYELYFECIGGDYAEV